MVRILVPTVVMVAVLVLLDTYRSPRRQQPWEHARTVLLAVAVAVVANGALTAALSAFAMPRPLLFAGVTTAWAFVTTLRSALPGVGLQVASRLESSPGSNLGSGDGILARVKEFEREVQGRTRTGYVTAAVIALTFGFFGYFGVNMFQQVGAYLTVAAAVYLALRSYRARPPVLMDAAAGDWRPAYRAELKRQRDFHDSTRLWGRLAVQFLGPILLVLGYAVARPEALRFAWVWTALFVLLGMMARRQNLQTARRYQQQLDELDADASRSVH